MNYVSQSLFLKHFVSNTFQIENWLIFHPLYCAEPFVYLFVFFFDKSFLLKFSLVNNLPSLPFLSVGINNHLRNNLRTVMTAA